MSLSRLILMLACLGLSSCTYIVTSIGSGFGERVASAVMNSDDPDTMAIALPTYLLTLEGMLEGSESQDIYWAAAKLNSLYASQFAKTDAQKARLTEKSWLYAQQAMCFERSKWCDINTMSQSDLSKLLTKTKQKHVPSLYGLGSIWAGWIEQNSGDWNAVAKIGHVKLLMERVVELDESYESGSAHLYLGVLASLIPKALGGKPEQAQEHFKQAIALSEDRNLMAKVLYASQYAKLMFDRELHDQLLNEVVKSDPYENNWVLANVLAQQQAEKLLNEADDYF